MMIVLCSYYAEFLATKTEPGEFCLQEINSCTIDINNQWDFISASCGCLIWLKNEWFVTVASRKCWNAETEQAHSQDFQKGGYLDIWCACMHPRLGGIWGMHMVQIFKTRSSEIACDVILRQKQSHCSKYMGHRVSHPVLAVLFRYGHLLNHERS